MAGVGTGYLDRIGAKWSKRATAHTIDTNNCSGGPDWTVDSMAFEMCMDL